MKKNVIHCEWVCHACATSNDRHQQKCDACGCPASAYAKLMENHQKQSEPRFKLARELAMRVLFWSTMIAITGFVKFVLRS